MESRGEDGLERKRGKQDGENGGTGGIFEEYQETRDLGQYNVGEGVQGSSTLCVDPFS